jgi:hypothetical protein
MEPWHPSVVHIMQFFVFDHLPEKLQAVSQPFSELANRLADTLPHNPELTASLRKLLEAKDCAVRALIAKEPEYKHTLGDSHLGK